MTTPTTPTSGRTYAGMSQEERIAQRRQQFLNAGIAVFGTEGFRSVTVRRICKEAKLTDRYFYECCGSIESLLMDVYEHCIQKTLKGVTAHIASQASSKQWQQLIDTILDSFFHEMENPRVARICMFEADGASEEMHQLYNRYISQFAQLTIQVSQHYADDWQLSDEESDVIGNALIGGVIQVTRNWVLSDYQVPRAVLVSGTGKIFAGMATLFGLTTSQNRQPS
jgi:AcrR family transcriptional regulator